MGTEKSGGLRRVLGVGFGLAVSVGATIGVGILRTPGVVADQVHTPSTIVFLWTAAGLYTLLGASCLSELGTMLPQDGMCRRLDRLAHILFECSQYLNRDCRVHSSLCATGQHCRAIRRHLH